MGLKKATTFRQDRADWAKVRNYIRKKGGGRRGRPRDGQAPEFSLGKLMELLLAPIVAAEKTGVDPFPNVGRPLPEPEPPAPGTAEGQRTA